MLLSPLKISPLSKNGNFDLVASKCAYVFDGVNQDIVINNQEVDTILTGVNKQLSFNFIVKRGSTGSKQILFGSSDNSLALYFNTTNNLVIETYDTAIVKSASTTNTFANTTSDYYISFIYDGVTPANSKILVNGVDETLSANTLTSTIDTTTNDYYLASNGSASYLNGELKQFSINNGIELLSEHQEWILNTKLPNSVFSNIVKLLNFDSDPYYNRVTNKFAVLDNVNNTITTKCFDIGVDTQKITIAENTSLNNTIANSFSVTTIVRFKNNTQLRPLFGKMTSATVGSFYLGTNVTQLRASVIEGGVTKVLKTPNNTIVLNEWMIVTFVFDGANSKIYVNDVSTSDFNNITTNGDVSATDFNIGLVTGFSTSVCDLGYLQIFNKALTQTEVTEWYNNGNPINGHNTTFSANVVYTFNANDYKFNGIEFKGTDTFSGIEGATETTSKEDDLDYCGLHIATTRNLSETDRKCNGIVDKGQVVDRVFWTGQSNAYGVELLSNLPFEYTRQRHDIQVWRGSVNEYDDIDGTTAVGFPPGPTSKFGAQFSFAYKWVANTNRYLFLDQYAVGGSILYKELAHLDWNTDSVGEYFDRAMDENVLQDAYQQNYNVNIVAEVWNQHESDCETEVRANAYEANLTAYINKRRETYPNLKFVIILVHQDLPYPYKATVKQAQLNVAAALPNVITIDQDAFGTQVDNLHRNAQGYEDLGNAIYNALK